MVRGLYEAWRGPTSGWKGACLVAARILLGSVFLYASIDKILHPRLFADAVAAYGIAPASWVPWIAVALPWAEAAAGLCLWTGVWVDGAALVISGMLVVFTAGIASAMARGLDISCGCFSVSHDTPVGPQRIVEDLLLLAAALAILIDRLRPRAGA